MPLTTRTFTYLHQGYTVLATVWNEASALDPLVLFDYNNVLNAYPMEYLQKQAGVIGCRYAIVSLLITQGRNFEGLRERARQTGECIVALTVKVNGNREVFETGLKYRAMQLMHWHHAICALDDKPHEWYAPNQKKKGKRVKLQPQKKPVFRIEIE